MSLQAALPGDGEGVTVKYVYEGPAMETMHSRYSASDLQGPEALQAGLLKHISDTRDSDHQLLSKCSRLCDKADEFSFGFG